MNLFFTRHILFSILLTLSLSCLSQNIEIRNIERPVLADNTLKKANQLKFTEPDSSRLFYQKSIAIYEQLEDTAGMVSAYVGLSDLYAHQALFADAYDGYWKALFLADKAKNQKSIAAVYTGLGWLYSLYWRNETALHYFMEALNIQKSLTNKTQGELQALRNTYYAIATLYRKEKNIKQGNIYLDSAENIKPNPVETEIASAYINAERGYLYYTDNMPNTALTILLPLEQIFISNESSYLVILWSFIGDIYLSTGDFKKSKTYYLKSISAVEIHRSHSDYLPSLYKKISLIYHQQKNFEEAYKYLELSKTENERQFGVQCQSNNCLLEIKDEFRIEKEKQNNLIREQRLHQLEQSEKIDYLQKAILFGTIIFLSIVGVLTYRNLRGKHKSEQELLKKKQELELQKANEILEIKNKELTASALQVIEREETLSDLKSKFESQKANPNPSEINKIIKSINLSTSKNWEEFETRFVSVNKSFYDKLKTEFPNLSQGDQKICALIKLNFSSKDMAKLLGISTESVHTTRYRLRKKLNLERGENLQDFISKF